MSTLRTKLIRLAHENPALRADLLPLLRSAGCEKLPNEAMQKNCEAKKEEGADKDEKKASLRKRAQGPIAIRDPDVMIYKIDADANNSKFYEMKVTKSGGGYVLQRAWGRLTDDPNARKPSTKSDVFPTDQMAQMAMEKLTIEKKRNRYVDAKNRQYPIGLGAAGFGWGGQAACAYIPELRAMKKFVEEAAQSMDALADLTEKLSARKSAIVPTLEPLRQDARASLNRLYTYLNSQLAECR